MDDIFEKNPPPIGVQPFQSVNFPADQKSLFDLRHPSPERYLGRDFVGLGEVRGVRAAEKSVESESFPGLAQVIRRRYGLPALSEEAGTVDERESAETDQGQIDNSE